VRAACAAGKAKQKNVPELSEHKPSTENNGMIFLDIMTIQKIKDGLKVTKPNWTIMVDEVTGLKFSSFCAKKSGMVEPTCEQLHCWKEAGEHTVKFIQLCNDEFNLSEGAFPRTPAIAGDALMRGEVKEQVSIQEQKKCRSGSGKLLHTMRWSRPEHLNLVQELPWFMLGVMEAHVKVVHRAMKHCVSAPNQGMHQKPNAAWDPDFEFVISGRSDLDCKKNVERRCSVSGCLVLLCDAPVWSASRMQGPVMSPCW
jgi:hypothetical protein